MKIFVMSHRPTDVPSSQQPSEARAQWQSYASPGTEIELGGPARYRRPDPNPNTGGSDRHLLWHMSTAALVEKAVWAEEQGFDAIIQSNNFDHGVEASRMAVRIPVIGLGRLTLHTAGVLADRIGVTVPLDGYFVLARRLIQSYGMDGQTSGMRSLGFDDVPSPEQVPGLRAEMFARTVETMRAMVRETGAECIVPLGGAVIPSILDPKDLTREVGAPVLNPRAIGIHFAETCVNLGLAHSELTYPLTKLAD